MTPLPDKKFDCWTCKHRRDVPGSCHIRCAHPLVPAVGPLVDTLAVLASAHRLPFMQDCDALSALAIKGNPHGIRNGWFNWPLVFDPTWLLNCDGYERKETPNAQPQTPPK